MRAVVIVNRAAAGGRCGATFDRLSGRLDGLDHTVVVTDGPGHASMLAKAAVADGAQMVVSVGGDGTLFEVVNGVMEDGVCGAAIGTLPLGTGNCFARDLGLSQADAAVDALVRGRTRPVDVLKIQTDTGVFYSINLVSVGFSAGAGELTNRRFKRFGAAGYIMAVLATLARIDFPTIPFAVDGGPWDRSPITLLSVSNSRFTGGDMMMAPNANVADGMLDLCRVGKMGRGRFLQAFPKIFEGTHDQFDEIDLSVGRQVMFDVAQPVHMMVDGEIRTEVLKSITVCPGVVEFCA